MFLNALFFADTNIKGLDSECFSNLQFSSPKLTYFKKCISPLNPVC